MYGAVAFVVLQAADILVPALRLPGGFTTGVALLAFLGFPIALVLAWAFESTPGGMRRTDPARTGEIEAIVAEPASRRWPSGLFALAGIGRDEEAHAAAEEGLRRMPPEREAWRGTVRLRDAAIVRTVTGRRDGAIEALETLLAIPSELSARDLRLDPVWNPLRGDPRFEALAEPTGP